MPPPNPARGRTALLATLVVLLTAALFSSSLGGELVYDDVQLIGQNPDLASLANVPRLFARAYWDFLDPETASHIGYWRPLTATAHAVGYALGGGEPWGFHVLSVAVHALATLAAFFLVRRLASSEFVATAAALLFGLHPVHVESVAWISALNDPLFGLFALAALLAWTRWRDRGSPGVPLGAAALLALALLSKELAAATLPLIVLVDLVRARDADRASHVRGYVALGAVLALYVLARMAVFGSVLAGFDRTTTHFGVGVARLALLRVELIGGGLELLLAPLRLSLFHPFRPHLPPDDPALLRALALTAALVVGAVVLWRRGHRLAFAALLFVPAGISPALVRAGSLGVFPLSERFLYLPVLGVTMLFGLAAARSLPRKAAWAALALVAAGCAWRSHERIGVWKDEETLFRASAAEAPRSVYVQWGLGRVLLSRYTRTGDPGYLNEASAVLFRAQDLLVEAKQPNTDLLVSEDDYLQVQLGVGYAELFHERLDGFRKHSASIAIFEQLIERIAEIRAREAAARELGITPQRQHLQLERVYTALGTALFDAGRLAEADDAFRKALSLNPRHLEAEANLARLHFAREDFASARQGAERVLARAPGRADMKLLAAQCLFEQGFADRAHADALALHRADAGDPEPLVLLGVIELARRKESEALRWFDLALDANPYHGFAWLKKALALAALGSKSGAIEAFGRAAALRPDDFEAQYNCGAYLLEQQANDVALPFLERAYELATDERYRTLLTTPLAELPDPGGERQARLARVDRLRGRTDSARAWIARAYEDAPGGGRARYEEAQLLRAAGDELAAAEKLIEAAERLPDDYEVVSETGYLLDELGRGAEALPFLERAVELGPPEAWDADLRKTARRNVEAKLRGLRRRLEPSDAAGPEVPRDG